MAATCSHKDETRKSVSASAHGVAFMRSLEATIDESQRMFHDPYAEALGGEVGRQFVEGKQGKVTIDMINGLSVRTKRIDDELIANNMKQICVFGAGLDTRPWRIKKNGTDTVHYFEVDFPEVFDFKLSTLRNANAVTEFEYHPVTVDLSLPGWFKDLTTAGFNPEEPTFFILEGFVNYLTLDEITSFFTVLSNSVAKGSKFIMTCATPVTQTSVSTHGMHRFFPENPLEFFSQFGWQGQQDLVLDIANSYQRPIGPTCNLQGYYVLTAELNGSN